MIVLKSKDLKELPDSCYDCKFFSMDYFDFDCEMYCGELGDIPTSEDVVTKRHPDCPLIDIPDELADAFEYLAASYEVWKRSGNETPLKNALIDAIRFKTDGLSDEDTYRLIRGESINKISFMMDDISDEDTYKLIKEESNYLKKMKALELLRKKEKE